MATYKNIKQQKLIIDYRGGATLYFIDENQAQHQHDYSGGEIIDLYSLVISCFEPFGDDSILTCSCGWPECAGFSSFKWKATEKEILWDIGNVDESEDLFRFDKNQYINEVETIIHKLIKICGGGVLKDEGDERYINILDKKDLETFYSPFINSRVTKKRILPRHKVVINPDERHIYITETGKHIGINKKELKFQDTDIFGKPLLYFFNAEKIEQWHNQMKNPNIDWKKWNKEGIKIAKNLREELPPAFDIWYQYQNVKNNKLVQIQLQVE